MNVAQEIFATFVQIEMYVYVRVVDLLYAITKDDGIAIAPRIEFINQEPLIFLVFFRKESLRLEEVSQRLFLGFLHRTLQFANVLCVYAIDINVLNLNSVLLININVDQNLIRASDVFALSDFDFSIFEPLSSK